MWRPKLKQRRHLTNEILRVLESDIDSGRLAPGEQLPTHRELAEHLQVALGTVTRAYTLAQAQGLVTGTTGRGTFVAPPAAAPTSIIDFSRNLVNRDPRDGNIRAQLAVFGDPGQAALLLDEEQDPAGAMEHRVAAAEWIKRAGSTAAGYAPAAEDIVITSGVQHAMHTILATIAKRGDVVLTESLTFAGIKAIAALQGFDLRGLPMDSEGLDAQAFEDAAKRGAKFLYVTPTLHNPTTITMPARRRKEIAKIAEAHGVAILEDDVLGLFAPEAPLPIAAHAPGQTYYLVSTSKSLAPGLRIGYAVCPHAAAPGSMATEIANSVRTTVWETSPLMSALVARWLTNGTAARIIAFKREEVAARREIAKHILPRVALPPAHSPHWWISLPAAWRADDFAAECRNRGVRLSPAAAFAIRRENVPNSIRVCIGAVAKRERLQDGLQIVKEVLERGPTMHFTTT